MGARQRPMSGSRRGWEWYQTDADNSDDWGEGGRAADERTKGEKTNKLSKDPKSREGKLTIFIETLLCAGGFLYKTERRTEEEKRESLRQQSLKTQAIE